MIKHRESQNGRIRVIVATANISLELQQLLWVIFGLSMLTVTIGAAIALQGYWPILVIAMVQALLVSWALFYAWRFAWQQEVVEISDEQLAITHRTAHSDRRQVLDTYWVKVLTEPGPWLQDPIRVFLRSREQTVELGRFLGAKERAELVRALKQSLTGRTAW